MVREVTKPASSSSGEGTTRDEPVLSPPTWLLGTQSNTGLSFPAWSDRRRFLAASGPADRVQATVDAAIQAASKASAGVRLLNMTPTQRQIVDDWCPAGAASDAIDGWFKRVDEVLTDRAKLLRGQHRSSWPAAWPAIVLIVNDLQSLPISDQDTPDRVEALKRILKFGPVIGVYALFSGVDRRWDLPVGQSCVQIAADDQFQFVVGEGSDQVVVNSDR